MASLCILDGAYIGSTDRDGRLGVNTYGGQHIINVSKQTGTDTYSGSWTGTIECYYPTGGTNYVPITINQIPVKHPLKYNLLKCNLLKCSH